jgi:hypothetical protein
VYVSFNTAKKRSLNLYSDFISHQCDKFKFRIAKESNRFFIPQGLINRRLFMSALKEWSLVWLPSEFSSFFAPDFHCIVATQKIFHSRSLFDSSNLSLPKSFKHQHFFELFFSEFKSNVVFIKIWTESCQRVNRIQLMIECQNVEW